MREVINGIFYILVAGCAWHLLPHDLPKGKTVYHYRASPRKAEALAKLVFEKAAQSSDAS